MPKYRVSISKCLMSLSISWNFTNLLCFRKNKLDQGVSFHVPELPVAPEDSDCAFLQWLTKLQNRQSVKEFKKRNDSV